MLFCGITAIIVSTISLRTVDDYFIIITLGIQVVVFSIMNNWQSLTLHILNIINFIYESNIKKLFFVNPCFQTWE